MISFDGVTAAQRSAADHGLRRLADGYLFVLGKHDLPSPRFVVRDNLDVKWLGRCVHPHDAPNTLIEIQKAVLSDGDTLVRVVAHEIVHHVQFLTDPPTQAQIKYNLWDGHGQDFERYAAMINEHEGRVDFVTKKSDQSYSLAASDRERPHRLAVGCSSDSEDAARRQRVEGSDDQGRSWSGQRRASPETEEPGSLLDVRGITHRIASRLGAARRRRARRAVAPLVGARRWMSGALPPYQDPAHSPPCVPGERHSWTLIVSWDAGMTHDEVWHEGKNVSIYYHNNDSIPPEIH